jgi:hypothetical protein
MSNTRLQAPGGYAEWPHLEQRVLHSRFLVLLMQAEGMVFGGVQLALHTPQL